MRSRSHCITRFTAKDNYGPACSIDFGSFMRTSRSGGCDRGILSYVSGFPQNCLTSICYDHIRRGVRYYYSTQELMLLRKAETDGAGISDFDQHYGSTSGGFHRWASCSPPEAAVNGRVYAS